MDLRDLWRPGGRLTWRRLGVLINHLPPESATTTALRLAASPQALKAQRYAPEEGCWSRTDMLLAELVDAVARLTHITLAANGVKTKPPVPLRRPGAVPTAAGKEQPRRGRLSPEEKAAIQRRVTGRPAGSETPKGGEDQGG